MVSAGDGRLEVAQDRITNGDIVYVVKKQRDLNFLPGERYLYSNTGYTLLGQIVEAVSGQTLREFTTERIFKPLGMTRTHFRDDFSEIVKNQAVGYRWDDDTAAFHSSVTNFDTVGATSLLTTVEDMARWDRNFIDPVVGGSAFLDLIHQRGTLNSGEDQDYAFGLEHGTYRGLRTVGHGGGDAGCRAHFVRFPDQGTSTDQEMAEQVKTRRNEERGNRQLSEGNRTGRYSPIRGSIHPAESPLPHQLRKAQIVQDFFIFDPSSQRPCRIAEPSQLRASR